ncbi:MAG: hypothetical protein PHG49_02520 [Candidatus Pacebacteria bacterium]|nr:hypothetical protein [Candidatus Paceibacterota bacterium]
MNDPNSQNNQDLNNQPNSQVDPNFLPKDSNVYIRTMKTDLNNLKEKGGENLPYIEKPANVNDFSNTLQNGQNNTPAEPQPFTPQTPESIPNTEKKDDNIFGNQDFNAPKPEQAPQMPEMPSVKQPENIEQNTFDNQQFGVPDNSSSFNQPSPQIDSKKDDNIFGNQDFNAPKPEQAPQMPEMPSVKQPENIEQNTFDNQQFGAPNNENIGSVNNIKDKIKELNTDPNAKPIDSMPGN